MNNIVELVLMFTVAFLSEYVIFIVIYFSFSIFIYFFKIIKNKMN